MAPGKRFLSLKPALQIMSISPPLCDVNLVRQPHGFPLPPGWGAVCGGQLGSRDSQPPGLGASLLDFKSDVLNNVPVLVRSGAHHPVSALRAVQVS